MQRLAITALVCLVGYASVAHGADELPFVPEGFVVDVVAKEPLVSNPCVMAFDRQGRIFVGQGQQWRAPTPATPGDRVDLLVDDDRDGTIDRIKAFAEGFNSIQGLAWKGRDLWVANAPDLTVVRDLDGDDEADEYVRVYTGLGNLEHSLHGLNFAPDGKLYMSKGNSRGYNRLDQLAPKAFRELWGLPSPAGAPDYTPIEVTDKNGYQRKYHTPSDDWGQQGGILRCDPVDEHGNYGRNLEIVARGFRNPWDITFDDGFDWLGTDNDQTQGDKIFAPFYGAHFGWGHSWSYHWTGEGHLPSVPASAPLFEGSGAGVAYYHADQFPAAYRDVFFVNDWMRREVYLFRPQWDGGLRRSRDGFPGVFAHAGSGRSLPGSSGRVFEPTDIEVGPDGALYVLSWGHSYGATIENGKQVDAGRVYRIRFAGNPLTEWQSEHRTQPIDQWTLDQLFSDLGSNIAVWRVDAQEELVRRATREICDSSPGGVPHSRDSLARSETAAYLLSKLAGRDASKAQQTWGLWALGRIFPDSEFIDAHFKQLVRSRDTDENSRIQALRVLGFRGRKRMSQRSTTATHSVRDASETDAGYVRALLASDDPRFRHEMVQAIWQAADRRWMTDLLKLAAGEQERVTFYSAWNALRELGTVEQRKSWLADARPGVRLAALLGLFEDDEVSAEDVLPFRSDNDPRVAAIVESWLQKTGAAEPLVSLEPPPGEYNGPISVTLRTSVPGGVLTYTTDGSAPVNTSPRYGGPITIDRTTTLRVAVAQDYTQAGRITTGEYQIRHVEPYRHRAFISDVRAEAPGEYRMDWTGLSPGKRHYTDRSYHITGLPDELLGLPFLQTWNGHDRSSGKSWLTLVSDCEVDLLLGIDVRVNAPLKWMKIGQPGGFVDTGLELVTTDPTFRIFRKTFPAGEIVLGGNTNDPRTASRRGNYILIFDRPLLSPQPTDSPATSDAILAALETADTERGRELFLHPKGAGCVKCHVMEGLGNKFAPDLSDIGSRAKKPEILIESILTPSAVITEGFAQQQIITTKGRVHSGAVLEETGRSIKLVDSEGQLTEIPKSDIEERIGTKLSPMPAGFDKLLSAQQIADVVAWLMTHQVVGDRSGFSFRDKPNQLDIYFGEQRIATYLKDHPRLTRRALVNVMTPAGTPVTRNFPPRHPEDIDPGYAAENGMIHPTMHPGIWIGFGDIDGNDYWRLQAKVLFGGFVEPPQGNKSSGSFAVRNRYMSEDGNRLVCTETTRYRFARLPEGLYLQIDAEFQSDAGDFYFGDQEESGLAVRVASPIRVQGGNGTILNNRGERNGGEVWGKPATWFDYFGTIDDREVGVMVISNPDNPRPSWLHARDYGVVVTNPFPKQPRERREPYVKTWVRNGEVYSLSYAIVIHELQPGQELDRESVYKETLRMLRDGKEPTSGTDGRDDNG